MLLICLWVHLWGNLGIKRKQQIPILYYLIWSDLGLKPSSTTLKMSTFTITTPMRSSSRYCCFVMTINTPVYHVVVVSCNHSVEFSFVSWLKPLYVFCFISFWHNVCNFLYFLKLFKNKCKYGKYTIFWIHDYPKTFCQHFLLGWPVFIHGLIFLDA